MLATDSVLATCAFLGLYTALHQLWPEPKRRAWIITSFAAALSLAFSSVFISDVVRAGGDLRVLGARRELSRVAVSVFQGYLVADTIAGAAHYASQMNLLTGWIHHAAYIALLQYILARGAVWSSIFSLALIMELPTFLLGLARLVPATRNDTVFTISFFATRICFHLVLIASYAHPALRPAGSWGPCVLFCAAFPMHAMWFSRQLVLTRDRIFGKPTAKRQPIAVSAEEEALRGELQSPPPELSDSASSSASSSALPSPTDEPTEFVRPKGTDGEISDLHLLRHALTQSERDEPLRIRALLAAASRGRYAALAARARGLYREAWARRPSFVARGETALRREIVVN